MSLSAARSRVMFAKENLTTSRVDDVEPLLRAAEEHLADLPAEDEVDAAALRTQIAEVRTELAALPTPDETRLVSAAKGKLRQARDQVERNYLPEYVVESLDAAAQYLAEVRDQFRDPVLAEINEMRGQFGVAAAVPVAATAPQPDPEPSGPPLSDAEASRLSQATGRIRQARSLLESRRTEEIAYALDAAVELLAGVPEGHHTGLLTEIEQIRADALEAERVEKIGSVERALRQELSLVDSVKEYDFDGARRALARFHERFARDDVAVLPEESKEQFRIRAAALTAEVDGFHKADALGRAESRMRDLEAGLAGDPFAGLRDDQVYQTATNLEHMRNQVLDYLRRIPEPDPDVRAMRDRLAAADGTLAGYNADWAEAKDQERVTGHWNGSRQSIAGWVEEAIDAAAPSMYGPSVPHTRAALLEAMRFQGDKDIQRLRDQYPGNTAIQDAWREAGEVVELAAAKVNAAFVRILEHAEARPAPMFEDDLNQTVHLRAAAGTMLEGTPYQAPVAERIDALDTRWRAEYAELIEGRRRLYDALSVEAAAVWPGIVAASGAARDFDPRDAAARGTTVVLSQVYNRCGWEWSGRQYGFAMRHRGMVLGGVWEPHVLRALEHAWYELKLDVNDRIPWDLIAVVDGPDRIGERTMRAVRDAGSGLEIATVEEWPAVDCLRLRVVGLHAGPVAVGPEGS